MGNRNWKFNLKIEIEIWIENWQLTIGIENWNWKLKFKVEIENWELTIDNWE